MERVEINEQWKLDAIVLYVVEDLIAQRFVPVIVIKVCLNLITFLQN